jgi:acyl carrier protein
MKITPLDVHVFIKGYLTSKLKARGLDPNAELSEDCDILLSGMIDSLGLLELVTALGEHYKRDIDFDALDPEQMTVVGPLCRFVAEQASKE